MLELQIQLWVPSVAAQRQLRSSTCRRGQLEAMHIFVKTSRDNTITLDVSDSTTIEGLQAMLWAIADIPPAEQRLFFAEEADVENSRRLSEYNILPGSILLRETFKYSERRRLLSELVRLELEEET